MDDTQHRREAGSLLLVDDDLPTLQTMDAFLTQHGYKVRCALDGRTALMFSREDPPELILLDVRLPDMDGLDVCRRLKEDRTTSGVPVIFLSGLDEPADKLKGFVTGGVDYITKPFQAMEMLARVETHLALSRLQKQIEAKNAQLEEEILKTRRAEESLRKAHDELEERIKERTADLALANERLRMALDSAEIGLWSVDIRSRRLWNSQSSWNLLGLERGVDLTGEVFFGLIHPEDRERVRQTMEGIIHSGEAAAVEFRIVHRDGNIRWIISRAHARVNIPGEPDCLMGVSIDITKRKLVEEQLRTRLQEIESLKERLEKENVYLQEEVKLLIEQTDIVDQSAGMKKVLGQAAQVARTESTVLLLGETGTGKELMARAIHRMSSRKDRSLVTINCASLPPTLIEGELFGREKGAYTGALTKVIGRFEIADGATLFLDEIGEIPLELQSKLLRVLETGQFERLGSTKSLHTDVRIIAATNRDLSREVASGKFRRDLFYRLNIFPIVIPPLRDRPEDIPPLVWAFVKEFQKRMGKEIESISRKSMEGLQAYSWPGNVRELRNVVERAMIVNTGKTLVIPLSEGLPSEVEATDNLEDTERKLILSVLQKTGWRVGGPAGAAKILGLKRSTLYSKMKKLGIKINRPTA
jgi:PAS domain S-box-containing protein